MLSMRFLLCVLLAAAPSVALGGASPSLKSTGSTVQLTAILHESLGIASSPRAAEVSLEPSTAPAASEPLTITTRWNLGENRTRARVNAFMSEPGMRNGDGAITTAAILSRVAAGGHGMLRRLGSGAIGGPASDVFQYDPLQMAACINPWGARTGPAQSSLAGGSLLPSPGNRGVLIVVAEAF